MQSSKSTENMKYNARKHEVQRDYARSQGNSEHFGGLEIAHKFALPLL